MLSIPRVAIPRMVTYYFVRNRWLGNATAANIDETAPRAETEAVSLARGLVMAWVLPGSGA